MDGFSDQWRDVSPEEIAAAYVLESSEIDLVKLYAQRLPVQRDEGDLSQLAGELESWAPHRSRATRRLLNGDAQSD